jgi:transposase
MRYELTDFEWAAIKPFLPNKPRGVPRVNDRRVLNGIFWVAADVMMVFLSGTHALRAMCWAPS